LIDEVASNLKLDNLAEMVHLFEEEHISQIMVEAVPESEVDKYGIADIKGEALSAGMSLPMQAIVEKPPRDEAPSNLAVVGRYVLSANIWPLLEKTPAGAGDEIQLTDAIAMLMEHEQVNAYFMKGRSHDCGSKMGYMKANVEYAVRHSELNGEFTAWLKQFVKQL
jgi:UTP--glucose-1-phosphate uridylyltransferase